MIKIDYMTISELEADLDIENKRLEMLTVKPIRVGEAARASGAITFDSFRARERLDPLVPPQETDPDLIKVGCRVLLLRRIRANTRGEYKFSVMIVLGCDRDTFDGYVFDGFEPEYRRVSVHISQIFDCISPLGFAESDLASLTHDPIPF